MKNFITGVLAASILTPLGAQIVTIHGTVEAFPPNSYFALYPGVSPGDKVTDTFVITHFDGISAAGALYNYTAKETLQESSLGTLVDNETAQFTIQDITGASGIITFENSGNLSVSTELWSSNSSVLKDHFLVSEDDPTIFDWLHWGNGHPNTAMYDSVFIWTFDSVDVRPVGSPVPEASTFGYIAAAGLVGLSLYKRSKAKRLI